MVGKGGHDGNLGSDGIGKGGKVSKVMVIGVKQGNNVGNNGKEGNDDKLGNDGR